jgi:hypothetical protein
MSHQNEKHPRQAVNPFGPTPGTDHGQDEAIALQQQIAADNQVRAAGPPEPRPLPPFAPDPLSCAEGTAEFMDPDQPL